MTTEARRATWRKYARSEKGKARYRRRDESRREQWRIVNRKWHANNKAARKVARYFEVPIAKARELLGEVRS